jgi:hypothetical protein
MGRAAVVRADALAACRLPITTVSDLDRPVGEARRSSFSQARVKTERECLAAYLGPGKSWSVAPHK